MDEDLPRGPPELQEVERNLFSGSRAALFRVALAIPIYILLTPFTLKYLHADRFAIWSFNATIIGILNLTDLGLKNSLLYYCARNVSDLEHLKELLGTALCIYWGLWVLIIGTTAVFLTDVVDLLHVPVSMQSSASFVVIITVLGFGLRFISMPMQAVIEAHHGVAFTQKVLILWLVINAAATFLILPLHADLYTMGWISLGTNALVFLVFQRRLVSQFPYLRLRNLTFHIRAAHMLSRYGVGVYFAAIMITLREPLYKIFLSRYYGLPSVADFEISFRLCTQLISAVISPLLGTFAAAAVLSMRPQELTLLLRPLWGFTLLILLPLALGSISFSPWLVTSWLGANKQGVAVMLPWVFSAYAIYYATEVLYQGLLGGGGSKYSAVIQTATLAVCAALLYALKSLAPALDVGVSIFVGFSLFSCGNLVRFNRRFPSIKMYTFGQIALFSLPSIAYISLLLTFNIQHLVLIISYAAYLFTHAWVAHRVQIVDPIALFRRLLPKQTAA
jgi:O-antigen/teichoic acid export membrane protein